MEEAVFCTKRLFRLFGQVMAGLAGVAFTGLALAQEEASSGAATAAQSALSAGDTAWMMTSTLLVILMIVPGLALFYGGLARSKNMMSVLIRERG